jgi:hypothetical protein
MVVMMKRRKGVIDVLSARIRSDLIYTLEDEIVQIRPISFPEGVHTFEENK